jgi:hypothetical protein
MALLSFQSALGLLEGLVNSYTNYKAIKKPKATLKLAAKPKNLKAASNFD